MNTPKCSRVASVLWVGFLCAAPAAAQEWIGHTSLSPNGDGIVSTEAWGEQRSGVWDWRTRRLILEPKDFNSTGVSAFSADGAKLAYTGEQDRLRLIELPGGKELPAPDMKEVQGVAFVNGDAGLLAWDFKHFVLWNLANGKPLADWPKEGDDLHTVSPDGKTLALIQKDGRSLKLIDLATAKERPIAKKLEGVWHVMFQQDGARLAVYTEDDRNTVRQFILLDAANGKELARHDVASYGHPLALSPDGKTVAVFSEDGFELRNATTWRRERTWGETRGPVEQAAFSPDGRWLAYSVERDEGVEPVVVRELATGRERAVWNFSAITPLEQLQFAAGGKVLLATNGTYSFLADLGRLEQTVLCEDRHDGPVMTLAASPNGKRLASGGLDRTVRLWDAATGGLEATLVGHRGLVLAVAFTDDGKTLASGSADKTVRLWDPQTGKLRTELKGHGDAVCALACQGDVLAAGCVDGTIKLWDIDKGAEQASFRLPGEKSGNTEQFPCACALAFSPDGSRLAVSGGDPFGKNAETLLIYDVKTRKAAPPWKGRFAAGSLLWSPDGKTLVTAGGHEAQVQVWNVEKGTVEKEFKSHPSLWALTLAWRGKALAVGTGDPRGRIPGGEVRLWDPLTGTPLGAGLPLPAAAMSMAPLADGRLAIGAYDGSVVVWTPPKE